MSGYIGRRWEGGDRFRVFFWGGVDILNVDSFLV